MAHSDLYVPRAHVRPIGEVARDSLDIQREPLPKRPRTEHSCDICGKSYSERRTLVRHQRTPAHCRRAGLTAIPSYPCDLCGQDFTRDDLRHRHEKEVHFNIIRSTGHVRPSTIAGARTDDTGRSAGSQSVQTILDSTSTPSAATVSPFANSTLSLGTQSTPPTELEPEPSQAVPVYEVDDTEMDYFPHDDEAFALPVHTEAHSEFEVPHISPISGEEPSNSNDGEFNHSTPELVPDTASIRSTSTVESIKSRFLSSTNLLRSALIYKGATPRVRGYKLPVLCALCNEHLGSSIAEVRAHLGQHSKLFNREYRCETCQISFTHEPDLILHEKSVIQGHCGSGFEHIEECQGHHPPDVFSEMLTDNDRLQFTLRLQHWEHAQLKAYLDQVTELMHGYRMSRDGDCWSIDALFSSLVSLSSTQGYRKPRSALEPGEQLCRLHTSRLTGALANFDSGRKGRNLALAALTGNRDKVRGLVLAGLDVNAVYRIPTTHSRFPQQLLTPLEAAIESGDLDTVKLLVDLNANVDKGAITLPLIHCIEHSRADMAEVILEHGARLNGLDIFSGTDIGPPLEYLTSLEAAVKCGEFDIVKLLMKFGANPNTGTFSLPLFLALKPGRADIAELLLTCGARVNAKSNGMTALDLAVSRGFMKTALLLLRYGANVGAQTSSSSSALIVAVSQGDDSMVELLLSHGANVYNETERNTLIDHAIHTGHTAIGILLSKYAPHMTGTLKRDAQLRRAALHGDMETLNSTVASSDGLHKINPQVGDFGRLLQFAACHGRNDVVEFVLDQGADVNSSSGGLGCALAWAISQGNEETVGLLLSRGAQMDYWAGSYSNALECATAYGHRAIAALLLEKGASKTWLNWRQLEVCDAMLGNRS